MSICWKCNIYECSEDDMFCQKCREIEKRTCRGCDGVFEDVIKRLCEQCTVERETKCWQCKIEFDDSMVRMECTSNQCESYVTFCEDCCVDYEDYDCTLCSSCFDNFKIECEHCGEYFLDECESYCLDCLRILYKCDKCGCRYEDKCEECSDDESSDDEEDSEDSDE